MKTKETEIVSLFLISSRLLTAIVQSSDLSLCITGNF